MSSYILELPKAAAVWAGKRISRMFAGTAELSGFYGELSEDEVRQGHPPVSTVLRIESPQTYVDMGYEGAWPTNVGPRPDPSDALR